MKTKPTQHATRQAQAAGIQPDVIIARSELPLDKKRREKVGDLLQHSTAPSDCGAGREQHL